MNWFYRKGQLARGPFETVVDNEIKGWQYTGLRVAELSGNSVELASGSLERIIVPLSGSFSVEFSGQLESGIQQLVGRHSFVDGPTDTLYLPIATSAKISGSGRVAIAEGTAAIQKKVLYIPASEVAVELRGAGRSTRQVHNFGTPQNLDADRLIVCEVITPSDNWSSYPPHKHDEFIEGSQSNLEEIYYFEVAAGRGLPAAPNSEPMGYFRNYGTTERPIDTLAEVRSGDVALVPHGWHGPAMAAPGYDLYYLNVMAGPDPDRSWNIVDDPHHGWIRETWKNQQPDSRLPYKTQEH